MKIHSGVWGSGKEGIYGKWLRGPRRRCGQRNVDMSGGLSHSNPANRERQT